MKLRLNISGLVGFLLILHFNVFGLQQDPAPSRFSPRLSDNRFSGDSFYVLVNDTVAFKSWARHNLPGAVLESQNGFSNIIKVKRLSKEEGRKLMVAPFIQYMETTERYATPEKIVSGFDLSVNGVTTIHHLFPLVTGGALKVSVKENAFDKNDVDLKGRIYQPEKIPDVADGHATSMATIIAGAGNSSPEGKGIACGSILAFSDFNNLLPEVTTQLIADGITVQNHSYGVGIENYYGIESQAFDRQCSDYPQILHVFSAGNSGQESGASGIFAGIPGFANLTGQFKVSKNTLAVGGVTRNKMIEPLSSRGPSHDGRVKPELVAYGDGGTSEAAAIVSGIAVLAQEVYKNTNGTLPPSSLIKAAFINSADDLGRPEVDYEYGFGNADAVGALRSILEERFFLDEVNHGQEQLFSIEVPANVYRLKVSLVWNDPEAEPGADHALVNDLDLELTEDASGIFYEPWALNHFPHIDSLQQGARRKADHLNNAEQITVNDPADGTFTIKVKGFNVPDGPQAFSLVYEFESGFQWIYPTSSDAIEANKNTFVRWQWKQSDKIAHAEYAVDGSDAWVSLGEVNLSDGYLEWLPPDDNRLMQLRLVYDNKTINSETFVVSRRFNLEMGFNCEKDALFFWQEEGAQQYKIFELRDNYLTETARTTELSFAIQKVTQDERCFAVAPMIQGKDGLRSVSTYLTGPCFINSFLAREVVTDSVVLDLTLGTHTGVQSISLERQSANDFQLLATINPVESNTYTFPDPHPQPEKNVYRIKLVRQNQQVTYSDVETVFYTRDENLIIYPNPVYQGEPVSFILNSDPVEVTLYDFTGRKIREFTADGEIKIIHTNEFKPGVLFMKVITNSGKRLTGKIILR
jgi:hypothetical protein